jgi:predicted ATP-dependent protease
MGGNIHHKGVHILSGYLSEKFGRDKPLSLSARLVFEQSYSGVEGDSASSTELYALLSALSGVPIQQRFAVTGSVNQHGVVQAIGGVNQKIEGYFAVCKVLGLTSDQGVLIPLANVQNLMLKEEVVKAVQAGKFHIYAVETIDEGIELLTGKPASEINALADKRLQEMANTMREYSLPP